MKNYIKNLKNLREIGPSIEWTARTKNLLLNHPTLADHPASFDIFSQLQIFIYRVERKLIPSPVKIIATLLVLSLAGGTTLAAKAAIPGNPLYPVKTQIEKVELVLTTSSKKEAQVHLKHAKNRIFEVEQLTKIDQPAKDVQINKTVKNLEKSITAAQSSLESAEQEESNIETVVTVAVQINDGAMQANQMLNQTAVTVNSDAIKQTVSEATSATEMVLDNTTNLVIDKKENGEISEAVVSTEKVKEMVTNNINIIENKNKIVEEKVNQIETEKVNEAITNPAVTNNQNLNKEEVRAVADKPEEAKLVLEEARKLVNETALSQAMEKAKESKEITMETEKVLEKIDKVIKEQANLESDQAIKNLPPISNNSTSTPSSTGLMIKPFIELGGINNEADPLGKLEEEPVIEKTPVLK